VSSTWRSNAYSKRMRSLPLRPTRVHGIREADMGVHGERFGMAFSLQP
jgi:hypothetical protein